MDTDREENSNAVIIGLVIVLVILIAVTGWQAVPIVLSRCHCVKCPPGMDRKPTESTPIMPN